MKSATVKDKHLKLDQAKIKKAKEILKARTETEAVEKALELVIAKDTNTVRKKEIMKKILGRRDRIMAVKGNVSDWIREGREERDRIYGG